ncbi:MAG: cob(I)yrinic acid a,c-diamide adenosyltransferase [Desulfuromonadales bacterium]|nr:cob(I)yrinic acid a,c-diamide adenosyltransferase [Desulfuromonadales bacterium]
MKDAILQVYTGEGKGKTTAATGLMVRALGQGMRVLLVRFLKPVDPPSGELKILQQQPKFAMLTAGLGGVYDRNAGADFARDSAETFLLAREKIMTGDYDLVVLDELNNVLHKNYLPLEDALDLLRNRPAGTELVLTGRNAPPEVICLAQLVSRVEKDKHPFDDGLPARRGIEF